MGSGGVGRVGGSRMNVVKHMEHLTDRNESGMMEHLGKNNRL